MAEDPDEDCREAAALIEQLSRELDFTRADLSRARLLLKQCLNPLSFAISTAFGHAGRATFTAGEEWNALWRRVANEAKRG